MQGRRKSEDITINLTPMIDVVFLLLIFFMVGTKFSESESRVDVNVASAAEMRAMARLPDKRTVDVAADGSTTLDNQPMPLDQIVATLSEQHRAYPALRVIIRSDGDAGYSLVYQVMKSISSAGVTEIQTAMRPGSAGSGASGTNGSTLR